MPQSRRKILGWAAAAGAAAWGGHGGAVWAQSYPQRPVRFIVPWPTNGSADIAGRLYAEFLSRALGQAVEVVNHPGAGGSLGVGMLARAPADGYTLGQVSIGTQSINQFVYPALGFDPEDGLEHIGLQTKQPNILLVQKSSPFKSLQELVVYARAHPGRVSYGTPGIGSSLHLSGEFVAAQAGLQWTHVPFNGSSGSIPALLNGQVDLVFDNISSSLPHLKDGGALRALVVTSQHRVPELPHVPSAMETGILHEPIYSWFGIAAPKGLPPEVLKRLVGVSGQIFQSPGYVARLRAIGAEPGGLLGADYQKFQATERARWQKVVKANRLNIQN